MSGQRIHIDGGFCLCLVDGKGEPILFVEYERHELDNHAVALGIAALRGSVHRLVLRFGVGVFAQVLLLDANQIPLVLKIAGDVGEHSRQIILVAEGFLEVHVHQSFLFVGGAYTLAAPLSTCGRPDSNFGGIASLNRLLNCRRSILFLVI